MKCPTCNGFGKLPHVYDCPHCDSNHEVICPDTDCRGVGTIFNPTYKGDGVVDPDKDGNPRVIECPTCNGKGKVTCPHCNGTGELTKPVTCHDCNGTGQKD